MRDVALSDDALVTTNPELAEKFKLTSDGQDRIVLPNYDAFLLIGLGFRFSIEAVCKNCGTAEHLKWGPVPRLISNACFRTIVERHLSDNLVPGFLRNIRSCTAAPILICPSPFRTESGLAAKTLRRRAHIVDRDFAGLVMREVEAAGDDLAARHGAAVVWQDDATLAKPAFTRPEFALGGISFARDDMEAEDEDGLHMNEDYGRIVLTQALRRLGIEPEWNSEMRIAPPAKVSGRQMAKREVRERPAHRRRARRAGRMAPV